MAARIPSFKSSQNLNKSIDDIFLSIQEHGKQYEKGFLDKLMEYVKSDDVLKNFYIRYIYECEVVKTVIQMSNANLIDSHLYSMFELNMNDMEKASTIESLAMLDSYFHRWLFCIAEENEFYDWYKVNSDALQVFLNNFWNCIGIGTQYHHELIEIHKTIFEAIKEKDEAKAIDATQKHFAILLFQLLGMMY